MNDSNYGCDEVASLARIALLVETHRLNSVGPEAYLTKVLANGKGTDDRIRANGDLNYRAPHRS